MTVAALRMTVATLRMTKRLALEGVAEEVV
jgi:hypothetical protein